MGTTNNRREEKCVQVYWGDDMRKGKFLPGLSKYGRKKEKEVEKAPTNTCLCFSASSKSNLFSFLCFQLSDETSWFICLSGRPWFRFRKKSFFCTNIGVFSPRTVWRFSFWTTNVWTRVEVVARVVEQWTSDLGDPGSNLTGSWAFVVFLLFTLFWPFQKIRTVLNLNWDGSNLKFWLSKLWL